MNSKHKLPCDVRIGHIIFRKGVALSALVERAEGWFQDAKRLWDLQHPNSKGIKIKQEYK